MANLEEAKARYREAKEDTDRQRMYEGRSTKSGNAIYQAEVDAARYYIAALEEHIAIYKNVEYHARHRKSETTDYANGHTYDRT